MEQHSGLREGKSPPRTVVVPAGVTSGGFDVDYVADDVWTGPRSGQVVAYPVSGVGVADGYGTAEIQDDDPAPQVSVTAPASVREGDPVRIVVRLDRPTGVDVGAEPSFLRPDLTPRAGVADLPATWVRRFTSADRRDAPLWERYLELYADIEPGRRSVTLTIPTRADGVRERPERLRVRVDVPLLGRTFSPTVMIRDR